MSFARRAGACALFVLAAHLTFGPDVRAQVGRPFIRSDTNADGRVDIADAIAALNYLFQEEPLPCEAAIDTNGDGRVDIADAIYLLNYLFVDGDPPPAPFPGCGQGSPGLSCEDFPPCPGEIPDPPRDLVCDPLPGALEVDLAWTNAEAYDEVVIARDGETIARIALTDHYADAVPDCGTYIYQVRGTIAGLTSEPIGCEATVDVTPDPPEALACAQAGSEPAVSLAWRNATGYQTIQVLRGGEVVADLPGDAEAHEDAVPAYGDYTYEVRATVCGRTASSTACAVTVSPPAPTDLGCQDTDIREGDGVQRDPRRPAILLTWTNPIPFDAIRILRDGEPIASLDGASEQHQDLVPAPGPYTYAVLGEADGVPSISAQCTIESAARTGGDIWATLRFAPDRRLTAADPATDVWVIVGAPFPLNGWSLSIQWDDGLVFEHCEGALGEGPPYSLLGSCYDDGVNFEGITPWFYIKRFWDPGITLGVIFDYNFENILPPAPDRPILRLRFRAEPYVPDAIHRLRFETTGSPGILNAVAGRVAETPSPKWDNIWPLFLYGGEIRAEP